MDRAAYNKCMKPYITGTGKSQEERRLSFCMGAKVCSGKAGSEEEARQICLSEPPKEPKSRKSRKKTEIDPKAMAECLMSNLPDAITVDSLAEAIVGCTGAKMKTSTKVRAAEINTMSPEYQEALNAISAIKADYGT